MAIKIKKKKKNKVRNSPASKECFDYINFIQIFVDEKYTLKKVIKN